MATIKFYLTSKKLNSMVYLRFSGGRKLELRRKTGIKIANPIEDWSEAKQMPKTNSAVNKNLNTKLKDLSNHILKRFNNDFNNTEETVNINGDWLGNCIDAFFNRVEISDKDFFLNYAKFFVEELPKRTFIQKGVKHKYKEITIEKYDNIVNHFEDFEIKSKRKFKICDITNDVTMNFENYLRDIKNLSINTVGRDIKRIKTIVLDAEKNGFKISHKVKEIRGFEDTKIIVWLTIKEIDIIKDTQFANERLQRAKDWLIIACYTGQRIADLWRMKKEMIIKEKDFRYILFTQTKTGKRVKIPIHWEVEEVLERNNNNFPPMFSKNEKSNRTELGGLMKKVCKKAGINEKINARYDGKLGEYEKWMLIGNHSCRRSFCSNFYGNPNFTTPMLMEITGHVRETNFLKYIGEEEFKFSERTASVFAKQKVEKEIEKETLKNKLKAV